MTMKPLNIFFVKSDSKGDRLLFRYPFTKDVKDGNKQKRSGRHNPYAVTSTEDLLQSPQPQTSNICEGQLSGLTDQMLSTLFAVKAELCNRKFELKVNDVRFVGHPTLLPYRSNKDDSSRNVLINIVFALQASASHSVVKCYYDLSKRLGKALRHEEKRCCYLTEEMKIMLAAHDEVSALDTENTGDDEDENSRYSASSTTFSLDGDKLPKSAFQLILQRSSLARSMKSVFEELCSTGIVQVRINKWVLLSFCLPHKAHQIQTIGLVLQPEIIDKCLRKLKPYHGILLMVNQNELLSSIPIDSSQSLVRLIKFYSPLKSLQTLSIEADLTPTQVFQLTGHLVYWAKATVIYPLCEGNVYVVAHGAHIPVHEKLITEFSKEFPGSCLLQVLGNFSLPAPLWYHARGGAGGGADVTRLPRIVAWLLRRRLLMQLHTYVQFNSHWGKGIDGKEYFCEKHSDNQSLSYSSLNHIQLHIPEPVDTNGTSNVYADSDEGYPTENNLNQTDFSHTKPIIIESENNYDNFNSDSANHSFDEGVDVVDGPKTVDDDKTFIDKKLQANSVDSGFSNNNVTEVNEHNKNEMNCDEKKLTKRLSDISLKDDSSVTTSDDDKCSDERVKKCNGINGYGDKKNGIPLSLKIQNEMNFQSPTVWPASGLVLECGRSPPPSPPPPSGPLSALDAFSAEERATLSHIPAAQDPHDLMLLAQLHKKGYFRGSHHLEEIMFMENVTRSQVMQLLDKFKDVLITYETEDPTIAMLYPGQSTH